MASSRFVPGQYVGPYQLINKLGQGAFGEVWLSERASDLMALHAALKLPFDPDPDLVREEAETWKRASGHPNIVPVWDVGIDRNGQVYIASEYIAGGSLTDWLKQHGGKAPSLADAARMMIGILTGLEHLHAVRPLPVIHRDLKPDNILLQGGIPRLTDFGIARVMRSTSFTQHISGTPPYMAPEVFSGRYNAQSDLWAAGVIFYRLLTGNLPFPQTDMMALMGAIGTGKPAPLPASFPSNVRAILATVLQKDLSARYALAASMRTDVEALLYAPQTSPVPPPGLTPKLPSAPTATISQHSPQPPRSPAPQPVRAVPSAPTSRREFVWGVVGIGAIAVGVYTVEKIQSAKKDSSRAGGAQPGGGNTNLGNGNPNGTNGGTSIGQGNSPQIGTMKPNPTDRAEMMWIPAGTFQMGSDKGEDNEKPIHSVTLSGFWMYKNAVTVAQFRKYDEASGSKYDWNRQKPSWGWQDNHPMVYVTWTEAAAYAKWAGGALPTEAQWEYAARGGLEGKEYPWGDGFDRSKLCCSEKEYGDAKSPSVVGSYPANGYGLYDMAGNVGEWCADWYSGDYYKTSAAGGPNPVGPSAGTFRVLRGVSWYYFVEYLFRCAYRIYGAPDYRDVFVGFRCCAPR